MCTFDSVTVASVLQSVARGRRQGGAGVPPSVLPHPLEELQAAAVEGGAWQGEAVVWASREQPFLATYSAVRGARARRAAARHPPPASWERRSACSLTPCTRRSAGSEPCCGHSDVCVRASDSEELSRGCAVQARQEGHAERPRSCPTQRAAREPGGCAVQGLARVALWAVRYGAAGAAAAAPAAAAARAGAERVLGGALPRTPHAAGSPTPRAGLLNKRCGSLPYVCTSFTPSWLTRRYIIRPWRLPLLTAGYGEMCQGHDERPAAAQGPTLLRT